MSGTSRRSSELIAVPAQPRLAIGFGPLVRTTCKSSAPHDSVHAPTLELRCKHREWRIRCHAGRQPACLCATGLLSDSGQAAWRPAFQLRRGFSINIVWWSRFGSLGMNGLVDNGWHPLTMIHFVSDVRALVLNTFSWRTPTSCCQNGRPRLMP